MRGSNCIPEQGKVQKLICADMGATDIFSQACPFWTYRTQAWETRIPCERTARYDVVSHCTPSSTTVGVKVVCKRFRVNLHFTISLKHWSAQDGCSQLLLTFYWTEVDLSLLLLTLVVCLRQKY
jgi:hypothetical protein